MSLDRRIEIDRLLMQVLDLEDDARPAFLAAIEDASLRADVEEMLALCESDTDPFALDAAAAARLIDAAAQSSGAGLSTRLGFDALELPEQIGGWRIIERVGQGGMGEVLKVERIDAGFEQLGAMKLIRSGFGIGEFARRFLLERQILARLNHPGIAGLLDGGRDAQGHPFLVMEYVDGVPIDHYCDSLQLGLDARIELFIEVCRAVAHAHRSLVIHRDLKPSNILVRPDGRVKLLDFGIAKVLGDGSGEDPLATRIEQRMFTPDYASPEQVRGLPVTTASDVYQLGLLLYELLCGHRAQRVGHTGPASIERIVCEQDPTRPSQRIGSGDTELALRRHLQPRQLRRRLRGDLDTIVGKALQKLPERRYGTVDELIDDLIRSRQGRTLHARPDTWRYRMGRFVRRHPVGLAFAVLTLALLSIYLVTLNLQAQALERERDRAQAEAAKARQVQSLVQRLFEGIDPDVSGGEPLSVQALLDRSFAQIEGELGAHPDVRAELLLTVGDVYAALGNYARATELLTQAFELVEALEDEQPLLAAKVYRSRGRLLVMGNTPIEAAPMLERSLRLLRRAGNAYEDQIAATRFVQADLLRRIDRMSDAALASREALQLRRRSLSEHHPDLASSLNQLAVIDRRLNRNEEAELLLREAIHLLEVTLPSDHPRISETRADLAAVLRSLERIDESEALFKQAIAGLEESRGSDHPYLGIVLGNYGNLLLDQGRPLDALPIYQRALRICNQQYGTVHARTALAHSNLGRALNALGRTGEAISSFRWAISALPESHSVWQRQFRQNLGSLLLEEGAAAEALSEFERAYSLIRADSRGAKEAAVLLRWQAQARLRLGEVAIAADTAAEAVGLLKRSGEDPFALAEARALLGESLIALNRKSEAIEQLEQALALHRENGRATPDRLQAIENQLAQARRRSAQTPP